MAYPAHSESSKVEMAVISISYIVILLHYEIDTSSSRDDDDNDDIDDEVVDGKTTLWQPIKKAAFTSALAATTADRRYFLDYHRRLHRH